MGVPLLEQHGGADDNVPAFNSRRMYQLISQTADMGLSQYVELKGQGHWFDGVMSTTPLRNFYFNVLDHATERATLPLNFSIVVANPADMGSRGGILVDQLRTPNQLGKIDVRRSSFKDSWTLETSNIRRFHFAPSRTTTLPLELTIDGSHFTPSELEGMVGGWLICSKGNSWQVCTVPQRCWSDWLTPLDF